MNYDIVMPSLGADMDSGRFVEWKIKPGEHIIKSQAIAVIETQKAAVEIESFKSGKVTEVVAEPDTIYPVGAVLAKLELDPGEIVAEAPVAKPTASEVRISPVARKWAEENKIDFHQVKGSGPDGVIELKDVQSLVREKKVSSIINIRGAIAKAMSKSKAEIPHYYLQSKVNIDEFIKKIDELNQSPNAKERILLPSVFIYAVSKALLKYPEMNGYFTSGKFEKKESHNIGVVTSLKTGGVVVPAILGVQNKDLYQLDLELKDLIKRARESHLRSIELTEGTLTITNLGDLGADQVFGVIFPPQVALLGFGRVRQDAIIKDSSVHTGFCVNITLSADHRVSDGLSGARFLQCITSYLTQPSLLFEESK